MLSCGARITVMPGVYPMGLYKKKLAGYGVIHETFLYLMGVMHKRLLLGYIRGKKAAKNGGRVIHQGVIHQALQY